MQSTQLAYLGFLPGFFSILFGAPKAETKGISLKTGCSQFSSITQLCPTLCNAMDCSMTGFPVHHQLLKLTQIHVHREGDAIQPSHPLLSPSPCLQSCPASGTFLMSRSKYWSFSFSYQSSNEYSGLISFKIDWFDLPAVQRTLNSLLQHHSSKASVLQCSAFFMAQFSHPYTIIGKTIALTIWNMVSKVIPFLFNMLSRFIIAFFTIHLYIRKFLKCKNCTK